MQHCVHTVYVQIHEQYNEVKKSSNLFAVLYLSWADIKTFDNISKYTANISVYITSNETPYI